MCGPVDVADSEDHGPASSERPERASRRSLTATIVWKAAASGRQRAPITFGVDGPSSASLHMSMIADTQKAQAAMVASIQDVFRVLIGTPVYHPRID